MISFGIFISVFAAIALATSAGILIRYMIEVSGLRTRPMSIVIVSVGILILAVGMATIATHSIMLNIEQFIPPYYR
jgi:hypothetical protein